MTLLGISTRPRLHVSGVIPGSHCTHSIFPVPDERWKCPLTAAVQLKVNQDGLSEHFSGAKTEKGPCCRTIALCVCMLKVQCGRVIAHRSGSHNKCKLSNPKEQLRCRFSSITSAIVTSIKALFLIHITVYVSV